MASTEILTSIFVSLGAIGAVENLPTCTHGDVNTDSSSSSLNKLSPSDQSKAKSILLTLHFLFPHELLPALDLLDRKLVTCLQLTSGESISDAATTAPGSQNNLQQVYYVQSASAAPSISSLAGSTAATTTTTIPGKFRNALATSAYYEVNLQGWNCTCPAFAFSAMKLLVSTSSATYTPEDSHHGDTMEHQHDKIRPTTESSSIVQTERNDTGQRFTIVQTDWRVGGTATKSDAVVPMCKHILAVTLGKAAPHLFGEGIVLQYIDRLELAGRAAGWGER